MVRVAGAVSEWWAWSGAGWTRSVRGRRRGGEGRARIVLRASAPLSVTALYSSPRASFSGGAGLLRLDPAPAPSLHPSFCTCTGREQSSTPGARICTRGEVSPRTPLMARTIVRCRRAPSRGEGRAHGAGEAQAGWRAGVLFWMGGGGFCWNRVAGRAGDWEIVFIFQDVTGVGKVFSDFLLALGWWIGYDDACTVSRCWLLCR